MTDFARFLPHMVVDSSAPTLAVAKFAMGKRYYGNAATANEVTLLPSCAAKLAAIATVKLPQPRCRCLHRRCVAAAYTATALPPPPPQCFCQDAHVTTKLATTSEVLSLPFCRRHCLRFHPHHHHCHHCSFRPCCRRCF